MHTQIALRSFAISSHEGSASYLVTNDPLEVSPLARRDGAALSIHPITGWRSLFPASSARQLVSVLYSRACLCEASCRVYRVPLKQHEGVSPCLFTGSLNIRVPPLHKGATHCFAFWLKPVSVFGLLRFTMFTTVHLCWTGPSALLSDQP